MKIRHIIMGTAAVALLSAVLSSCGAFGGKLYKDSDKYISGNFTYDSANIKKVEVSWVYGNVNVSCGEGELNVYETGEDIDEDEKLHYYIDGDTLKVQFCKPGYSMDTSGFGKVTKDLFIAVPTGAEFSFNTTSANVTADEITAKSLKLKTVSGGVGINSLRTEGDAELNTTSGKITVSECGVKNLKVKTVSGAVSIDGISAADIDYNSTSGSGELGFVSVGEMESVTVSGNVTINLNGSGASVVMKGVSGKLYTELEHTKNAKAYIFGDGKADLRLVTTSGNAYIK